MLLKLEVLTSTTIKRKKPWPKLAWLGKDVGDLFLFDSHRISQICLPSGKTKKKIPLLQSHLDDVQEFGISSNGLFLAGALNSGRIFIWNKSSATVKLTPVLDKIRNVHPGARNKNLQQLCISDCGTKVLLLSGLRQVFLWETQGSNDFENAAAGDNLRGFWMQIQCGTYVLPDEEDKETAINGIFFVDPVCGTSFSLSWVFNKGNKIYVTTLHLLWQEKNYTFAVDSSSSQEHTEGVKSPFTPAWHTFKHSLYNLTPAERVLKSRKAYITRVSPDGQMLVIAMNQKFATHNRVMFYSLSQSAVAVIADLKGCGAKLNTSTNGPMGRSWWVADMAWTRDSLLVLCITRRGSISILNKLGEPMEICTEGCSLHTGPALYLPLHPKITFQSRDTIPGNSSGSFASERDPLSQRFSVSVHPYLPVILSSDGYLVTIMQLPPVASYHGVMKGFMKDVTRLVPDVDVEIQAGNLSRVSSVSRINYLQSEANISRGVTSTEFLSDAPSENNSSGSSSVLPGYGLASGDQGMSFFGLNDPELESSLPEFLPGSLDAISHAQSLSIMALALGSACGVNWKSEVGSAMDLTVNVVIKFFQFFLRSSENSEQLRSHTKNLSLSDGDPTKRRSSSPAGDSQMSRALVYFRTILEVFQWDCCQRNVFAWAFHLTHGVLREILLLRDVSVVYRVACSIRVLKLAERVLNLVYANDQTVTDTPCPESALQKDPVKRETEQLKQGSEQTSQESEQAKKEFGQFEQETGGYKQEFKQVAGESIRKVSKEGPVSEENPLGAGAYEFNTHTQQQSMAQTHLSGSWLLLYNFTSQSCKKMQRRKSSLFSVEESDSKGTVETKTVELLCEIQEKLQSLGVRIPTNVSTEKEDVEGVSAYLDGSHHSIPPEVPQDSLFSRRKSSLQETARNGFTTETSRTYGSPFRDNVENQQSQDTPRFSPARILLGSVHEQDSKTLLSILYLQLQQYDLRAALDLIYSLIEPTFSCEQLECNGNFSFLLNAHDGSHPSDAKHRMDVLLQNYPITRVTDKQGLVVVQTLARFMSAYFSNLSLYVFPPYQPAALPAFHDCKPNSDTELKGHSQPIEHIVLDRARIGQAVRDQGLYELWSANSTLELLLVSGLVSEGAWLARNLGDWKNAMLLSFANSVLISTSPQTATDAFVQLAFPALPNDIEPHTIALSRLYAAFKQATGSGETKTTSFADDMFVHSTATKTGQRNQKISVDPGTDVDEKLVKEISRILEAGVVAGLDLVPLFITKLLVQLKKMVSMFAWIVPEEFYLPYPPSYCPQPVNSKKEAMSAEAEKEEKLRSEIAGIVQRILLLLIASDCLAPCVKWYTEQLICTTERWCKGDRSDPEFAVPPSLSGYACRGFNFSESQSPKKKGKRSPGAPSRGKDVKSNEKLLSSITSVMSCFRDFCAIMWLLQARDKMSKSSRKYRQLRSQSLGSEEEAATIHSICWETLLWTTRLAPFSSLLSAEDKINDTLLTLLSELPPTIATAQLTAQFFNDPEVVQTASGRAKFKRLMAQFRGVTVQDGEGCEEPLSVVYRKKCMDWEDELGEREKLFGHIYYQFFSLNDAHESLSTHGRDADGSVAGTLDEAAAFVRENSQALTVGAAFFETESSYFQFLDTFFMITVSKTVLAQQNKAPYPTPLLSAYRNHILAADTRALAVLQQRAHVDTPAKPIKGTSSLFRSQSFTDVRFSRSKPEATAPMQGTGGDIKRSSSMNDVAKLGSLPGVETLRTQLLDLLPSLTWLSRWTSEGSSLPSSNFDLAGRGSEESLPVMRIHVPLPLLVNGLWLLQNVYWPWVSNAEVVVDIKVIRQVSPSRQLPDTAKERSPALQGITTPTKSLQKVLSDSNIQKTAEMSAKRNGMPNQRLKDRLEVDHHHRHHHHQSTPDMFQKSEDDVRALAYGVAESRRYTPVGAQHDSIPFTRPLHKDLRITQQLDRIPKSNSEPNIPNIVIQSPTTDEEKDFSGALKKRHQLRGTTGRSPTTYHSDPELPSPVKPVVTSTPAKTKHTKKTKRRERKAAEISDEKKTRTKSGSDGDASDLRKQHRRGEDATLAAQQSVETTQRKLKTSSQTTIRTAPARQGKIKKKPPVEKTIATTDLADRHVPEVTDGAGVVASDSRPSNPIETSERSQSSATEAVVSQGQMELLLVVRPGDAREPFTMQSGIPLLRIPTVVDSSQCSDLTSHTEKTTKAETASQTDRQTLSSAASQTPQYPAGISPVGHVTHHTDQQRLSSLASQTLQVSGIPPEQGYVTHPVQHRLTSPASQTMQYSGIPLEQGHMLPRPTQTVFIQTETSMEPKLAESFYPFLQHQQQVPGQQVQLSNVTKNPQPPSTQHQSHPLTSTSRPLPLLQFPVADPASKLDLNKMRLLEIPKRSGNSTLLHFPESKHRSSQPTVPDLSKIKFLEIQPKRESWANTTKSNEPGSIPAPTNNWPLLRMTGSLERSNGIDLNKVRLYEHPPPVREAWPLLETPKKAVAPKLIPLEKILAFEKGIRDKLTLFNEPPPSYPHEKENIRPPVENKPRQVQPRPDPNRVVENENKRNAASRQRRREALEKQSRPRSTSPLYKSRRGRSASRRKSSQGKIMRVQPPKKARKVEQVAPEKHRPENEAVTKKSKPSKQQTSRKAITGKSFSLSESDLELSELSDHVLDDSGEEEYFRIERSPEPFGLIEDDHRPRSEVREQTVHSHRETNKEIERVRPGEGFEDVIPGPPSMRHMRERIGKKLHEVDQQMAAYRSGADSHDKAWPESTSSREAGQRNVRQQNTVGVQVGAQNKPPQFKTVGFSDFPDRVGQSSTFKVTSSSQTDQPLPRSPPTRKDQLLVTSGVQTEESSSDSDHVISHAPKLPPDIFLNLQMPKPEEYRVHPPKPILEYDEAVIDQPSLPRERKDEVDVGVVPPARTDAVDQATDSFPVDIRGRQFLSVADIHHDQWLEIQSTPMADSDDGKCAEMEEEERKEGERERRIDVEPEDSSRKVPESPKYKSDEEETIDKREAEVQTFKGADRVTMEMMDSTDIPTERFHRRPFPTTSQSSARAISTRAMNERMKEISERIEAMDEITQNMDREFKSSRVLLSAIQSIDDVLNPSSTEVKSSRDSQGSRKGKPRRWGETAPWRTGPKIPPASKRMEDMEDSVDVDGVLAKKQTEVDAADVTDDKEKKQSDISDDLELVKVEDPIHKEDNHNGYDQREDGRDSIDSQRSVCGDDRERELEREEKAEERQKASEETGAKTSIHQEDVHSSSLHERERGGKAFDQLESLSLPQDKLREILNDKKAKRTRDPSPEAREQLKEWMNKKRQERQAEWKNQQEELRAQEHQPFMSPSQDSTSLKKMKLMEKERDAKHRKTEDKHKQKRIESASNLLSEMLAEPVPKPKHLQPNLRYGTAVNSRYSKPVTGIKKRTAERRKQLPKGSLKGKQKPNPRKDVNETAFPDSKTSTRDNYPVPDGTYHVGFEEILKAPRKQTTRRYDFIRTSSPVVTGIEGLGGLKQEYIDQSKDKFAKKEKIPKDDFWRSKSPTGAEFVTTQTYQNFTKNQAKRFKAREAALRKTPPGGLTGYGLSSQPEDVEAMGRTYGRAQPTDPLLPGGQTLLEIDRLLEDDDNGFTLDQEKLDGIESLLEGDEELRDLLSDVDWHSISKRADSERTRGQHSHMFGGREKRGEWHSKVGGNYGTRRIVGPAVPSSTGLPQEFGFDVSPWNTGQSLRTSDDVAQLLADVDEAVGNMSESTGSTRSHIDWEEVDKIMGEVAT